MIGCFCTSCRNRKMDQAFIEHQDMVLREAIEMERRKSELTRNMIRSMRDIARHPRR